MNYNIPVKIWIMDTHPNNAPICYVNPTSDMVVKPSRTTDHSGKIYLPFLHFWDPASVYFFTLRRKVSNLFLSLFL